MYLRQVLRKVLSLPLFPAGSQPPNSFFLPVNESEIKQVHKYFGLNCSLGGEGMGGGNVITRTLGHGK